MRLATRRNGRPDGELVVVAPDGGIAAPATTIAGTMQDALDRWAEVEPQLRALAAEVETGVASKLAALRPADLMAPLPRSWAWLDGSAYPEHGRLMQRAFNLPPIETDRPLMYQGLSDRWLGPYDDVPLPSEEDGIDFEGEFGVITGAVPMGVTPDEALGCVRLLVQINDWSLRAIAPLEMKTGFGWVQAKPACSAAPFAVTPDELGPAWRDGRIAATLRIDLNGQRFGEVNGAEEMGHGFQELVAHAARTRRLSAGTIIGSGTVSSSRHAEVGSSCLSERRAIDAIAGRPLTPFMSWGDRVRMEARIGTRAPFGTIEQKVTRSDRCA